MSIEDIKSNFSIYLKNIKSDKTESKYENIQDNNYNVFEYASEFKDFINSEYAFLNSNDSVDIEKLSNAEILRNEFYTEADKEEINKKIEESSNDFMKINRFVPNTLVRNFEIEISGENNTTVEDLLKELCQNEEFIKAIDKNEDGKLNTEEIQTFIKEANELDLDDKNFSMQDLIEGLNAIIEGKDIKDVANEKAEAEAEATKEQNKTTSNSTTNTTTSNTTSNTTSSTPNTGNNGTNQPITSTEQQKDLTIMTKDELATERDSASANLKEKQTNLNEVLNGNNSTLKSLEKKANKIYNIYQEQLSSVNEKLAKEVDGLKNDIETKDTQIAEKEILIAEKETEIRNYKTSLETVQTRKSEYKNKISELKGKLSEDISDENKNKISGYISSLQDRITRAEEKENKFKATIEKKREEVAELKTQKETLAKDKTDLETKLQEKETEINKKHPEISKYLNYYNDAKNYYNEQKAELIQTAKAELKNAQTYMNKVKIAFSNAYAKEATDACSVQEYNAEAGQKLLKNAEKVEKNMSGTGRCLAGVRGALAETYSNGDNHSTLRYSGNYGSAYKFADVLRGKDENLKEISDNFIEIECTPEDVKNLPAGAVVVFGANNSKPHGHICIMDGNGHQYSDWTDEYNESYYQKNFFDKGSSLSVFLPVS